MKKALFALGLVTLLSVTASAGTPEENIVADFTAAFPHAQNIHWLGTERTLEVNFIDGTVRCSILYDRTGSIINTIRYYTGPGELPPLLTIKLHKKLPQATIYGIIETATTDDTTYEIILQDEKHWYHVEASGPYFLKITQRFTKS